MTMYNTYALNLLFLLHYIYSLRNIPTFKCILRRKCFLIAHIFLLSVLHISLSREPFYSKHGSLFTFRGNRWDMLLLFPNISYNSQQTNRLYKRTSHTIKCILCCLCFRRYVLFLRGGNSIHFFCIMAEI